MSEVAYVKFARPKDLLPEASCLSHFGPCPEGWEEMPLAELHAREASEAGRLFIQWHIVRQERNTRLSACDWRVLPDAPGSVEELAAWRAYRQALRDVPTDNADPSQITWPVAPA